MSVTINNAGSNDLPMIEEIAQTAYSEHREKVTEQLWKDWIGGVIDSLRSGKGTLIVLKEGDQVIGVTQFYDHAAESELDGWPADEKAGSIRVFAVSPKHQGMGYGSILIKECIQRARYLSLSKLYLHTGYVNEAAIHVFEENGFKRVPEFDFYPYGQKEHLAIAYCLEL
jgi:ribosomal protein S18 acetylase RimI-like enzyme